MVFFRCHRFAVRCFFARLVFWTIHKNTMYHKAMQLQIHRFASYFKNAHRLSLLSSKHGRICFGLIGKLKNRKFRRYSYSAFVFAREIQRPFAVKLSSLSNFVKIFYLRIFTKSFVKLCIITKKTQKFYKVLWRKIFILQF